MMHTKRANHYNHTTATKKNNIEIIKRPWKIYIRQPAASSQSRNTAFVCNLHPNYTSFGNENRSIYANAIQSGLWWKLLLFFFLPSTSSILQHQPTSQPTNQASQWIETLSYSNGGYIIICELNWNRPSIVCLPARSIVWIEFSAVRNRIKTIHSRWNEYASLFMGFL